jgi:hypothetical protein
MAYDFHKLKTISVAGGEVTLRIPQRWGVWPDEDRPGYWGCYEEEAEGRDTDTGTLWIQVDHFTWHGDRAPTPQDMDMKREAESAAAREEATSGAPLLESSISPVEDGYRWHRVYDTEEGGEALRFWFSHFFLNQGPHMAVIAMNLVLPHGQMDDPEFIELREIMEREIAAAFLDPFRHDDEAQIVDVLGPLRHCNFGDWVKLTLPEVTSIHVDETSDSARPRWYCRLDAGSSYAGMFVESRTLEFRDDDGEPVLVQPEMYPQILEGIIGPEGRDSYAALPDGIIARDAYDDTDGIGEPDDDGRPFQGFRSRVWSYLRVAEGRAQLLTVLLLLPLQEHTRSPFPELATYLSRAVRRAQFPGFPEVERH